MPVRPVSAKGAVRLILITPHLNDFTTAGARHFSGKGRVHIRTCRPAPKLFLLHMLSSNLLF